MDLYRGEFLEGLRVRGGADLEQWMDARRRWYLDAACDAAWARTRELCASGEMRAAVATARFAVQQKPLHEPGVRQFLRLLASAGDSVGAVQEYRSFRRRMGEELGLSPHEETDQLFGTEPLDALPRPRAGSLTPPRPPPPDLAAGPRGAPLSRAARASAGRPTPRSARR